jgi:hypothetical protein
MRKASRIALATIACNAHACDLSAVGTRTQQLLQAASLTDAGVVIGSARGVPYKQYFGAYDDTTTVPVASATKTRIDRSQSNPAPKIRSSSSRVAKRP